MSRKQESNAAARLGGRVTPGSGSGWATKNDVRTDDLSLELKYTDKKSYSLKRADLDKAEQQALIDGGRDFAFMVGFSQPTSNRVEREYVIISREHFERLVSNGNPE